MLTKVCIALAHMERAEDWALKHLQQQFPKEAEHVLLFVARTYILLVISYLRAPYDDTDGVVSEGLLSATASLFRDLGMSMDKTSDFSTYLFTHLSKYIARHSEVRHEMEEDDAGGKALH